MARLFTCGFEENATTAAIWNNFTSMTIVSGEQQHSGTYAAKVNRPSGGNGYCRRYLSANKTSGTLFTRFYFYYTTFPPDGTVIHSFLNGSNVEVCQVQAYVSGGNNYLKIYNPLTTTTVNGDYALSASTWYRIEVKYVLSDTVGSFEVRVYEGDSETEVENISLSGQDTLNTNVYAIQFGQTASVVAVYYIDDVAINDETTGASPAPACNSWCGPGKICLLKPDGDTSVTWTKSGSTPAATNYEGCDDVPGTPNDATDYNADTQATNIDKLALTNMPAEVAAGDTIVLCDAYARVGNNSTTGTPSMILKLWDESGNVTDGPALSTDISGWRICATNEHLVYDATGKTKANLDSFSAGYKGNTADGKNKWITALWVNVEWKVAAGVEVTAGTDALTLTQKNASINAAKNISAGLDALILTTKAADVNINVSVAVSVVNLALTEKLTVVNAKINVQASKAVLTLTTYNPTVEITAAAVEVLAGVVDLSLTPNAADVNLNVSVQATVDNLLLTEQNAGVNAKIVVGASIDNLALTANPATVKVDRNVQAGLDALTLTELPASINAAINVQSAVDNLTLTGKSPSISIGQNVSADVAALTLTEKTASINAATNIQASVDALTVTTFPATITTNLPVDVSAAIVALSLTEKPADVNIDVRVDATTDALLLSVFSAAIDVKTNVLAKVVNLTVYPHWVDVQTEKEKTIIMLSNGRLAKKATTDFYLVL